MKLNLGLIGVAIGKSKAPVLHKLLGMIHGYEISYELFQAKNSNESTFKALLENAKKSHLNGCNITFPFKQIAMSEIAGMDASCRIVGSVNTLRFGSTMSATNTDFSGFIKAIKHALNEKNVGKVLLLGAGGVGRAVGFALGTLNAECIYIFDPTPKCASALSQSLNDTGYNAQEITKKELPLIIESLDGIANCSPIGHYNTPGMPIAGSLIGSQSWVFDAVYTPLQTDFLKVSSSNKIQIISGFELFLYQGIDAFAFWTSQIIDEKLIRKEVLKNFDLLI
ncbi:shikimate dehydrogenase [Litorivicinus sp.]|nr:shikimate dehydrogenase [Litorivicinus sp.]